MSTDWLRRVLRGTCVLWYDDEGWGALRAPELEQDVWCHFSQLDVEGYRQLHVGEPLEFGWEVAEQDGYHLRATVVRRPDEPPRPPEPADDRGSLVDVQLVIPKPDPDEDAFVTESRRSREVTRAALMDLWERLSPTAGLSMWEPESPSELMAVVRIGDGAPIAQVSAHANAANVLVGDEAISEAIEDGTVEQRAARLVEIVERVLRDAGRIPWSDVDQFPADLADPFEP